MSFKDCLISAVDQGAINREEAQALSDDFDARFAEARMGLGDDAAAKAAKDALEEELRFQSIEKARKAKLTIDGLQRLKDDVFNYRDAKGRPDIWDGAMKVLSHYGYAGYSSVRGRTEAIVTMIQGELTDSMIHFRRSAIKGQRMNQADLPDLVAAMHGEKVSNPTAKAMADAFTKQFETLRQRFNAAGGSIAKKDGFGLPHSHDGLKIRKMGKDGWKKGIVDRIDWDKTINPLTGTAIGKAGADRFLNRMYEQVTTEGWAHHSPNMVSSGKGTLSGQRQEHRVLTFKSAKDWMSYNTKFGTGDVIQTIWNHMNGMARDTATMEILTPNPDAAVEWLAQNVRHEVAKAEGGGPSMAKERNRLSKRMTGTSPGQWADHRIKSLYAELRGRQVAASGVVDYAADAKNVANSALLGSASVTAAVTDPFLERYARNLAGMPVMRDAFAMLKNMRSKTREQIIRDGAIWDEYLHVMEAEGRFMGMVGGHGWSQFMVDRAMTAFGLKQITTGRKLVHARQWHAQMADASANSFDKLEKKFKHTIQGFGFDKADWDIVRQSIDPQGFVTPSSIAEFERANPQTNLAGNIVSGGTPVAEKYAEMIASWTERAVPSGTPNARSFVTGMATRGTIGGEVLDAGLQFKSFGLSMTTLQLEAIAQVASLNGKWSAATYTSGLALSMTIGGAIALQLVNLADGKDLEDISPDNLQFWARALFKGGGFGLLGDFANSTENRFGGGMASTMLVGPAVGMISDGIGATAGNAMKAARGDDTSFGKDAVKFAGRYTPVASSWWATRAAYRRIVIDQAQKMVDPNARRSFRAKRSNLKRQTGQKYWWEPGDAAPDRQPQIANPPK